MISHAQNAEDVVLARLFRGRPIGTWIDVGAGHPDDDSVTKHFSDRGWTGINIEPHPELHRALTQARPNDVNLCAAASDTSGTTELWVSPRAEDRFHGTVEAHSARPGSTTMTVPTVTLREVAREHRLTDVEFLKIDVEGAEPAVLAGADFSTLRPRVLVIEAIDPLDHHPTHALWEPIVLAAGYRLTLFDGINRFYAAAEDHEAQAVLSAPANVLDGYEHGATAAWRVQAETSTEYALSLEAARAETEAYARSLEARLDNLGRELESLVDTTQRRLS